MKFILALNLVFALWAASSWAAEDFPLDIQTKRGLDQPATKKPQVKRIEADKTTASAEYAPKKESADTGAVNKNKKEPWFNF